MTEQTRERALREPWTVKVAVAQIPASGLNKAIEATYEEASSLAAAAGLRYAADVHAQLTLLPARGDQVHVDGRVTARVGQTCVVTLEPIENTIDEPIALVFAPVEQVRSLDAAMSDTEEGDVDNRPDPLEPIDNGFIDLGRIATDALFLAIDPYPRKPGAVFVPPEQTDDPETHPFAALKALKDSG